MKKIYQIPAVSVTRILTETVVAASLAVDASKTTDEQYVKGGNADWSDIWSE